MTDRKNAVAGSIIITAAALICGIVMSMIRKGPSAFSSLSLAYMFVTFCVAGGIFYSVLKYRGVRDLVFSVFVVTLFHLLVFKVIEPRYFLEFFLYYAMLGVSVWIYSSHIVPGMKRMKIGKCIALAIVIVVLYSVLTVIWSIFSGGRNLSQSLQGILTVQSLVGIALGLGLELGEMLAGKLVPGGETG